MSKSARISFGIMAAALVLIGTLHLAVLVITMLFGYFALQKFSIKGNRIVGAVIYVCVVVGMIVGLGYFTKTASVALPQIADDTIPAIAEYCEKHGYDLPFTDYASLKTVVLSEVKASVSKLGQLAHTAVFEIVQLLIGLVAAVSLFLNAKWGHENDPATAKDSLYATVLHELEERGITFYRSFAQVMGAQIMISAINTLLTAIFIIWNGFPYAMVIIVLTFICGLLPIIGNIISNTLIVGVAFKMSPNMALWALGFLVVIHKLEYFLNSKIIGDRIKTPMWMLLVGLVLGEKLMGVPGMIFAPIILHYVRVEASKAKLEPKSAKAS